MNGWKSPVFAVSNSASCSRALAAMKQAAVEALRLPVALKRRAASSDVLRWIDWTRAPTTRSTRSNSSGRSGQRTNSCQATALVAGRWPSSTRLRTIRTTGSVGSARAIRALVSRCSRPLTLRSPSGSSLPRGVVGIPLEVPPPDPRAGAESAGWRRGRGGPVVVRQSPLCGNGVRRAQVQVLRRQGLSSCACRRRPGSWLDDKARRGVRAWSSPHKYGKCMGKWKVWILGWFD